jgi:hypothetical protein
VEDLVKGGINMENEELIREYEGIFILLHKYHMILPQLIKSMDLESIDKGKKRHFHKVLINLQWHIYSLSDSVIRMNACLKYNEAGLFLRTMMENYLLLQYLYQYPEEAKRWIEFQELFLNESSEKDEYMKLKYDEFIDYLDKKEYKQVIQLIDERNFHNAKMFNPGFIRQFVDHELFFSDGTNMQLQQGSNNLYDILSKYSHPSVAAFEGPSKDIEIELENIKLALNFVDIICRIFYSEFNNLLSKEMLTELDLLNLSIMRVFDKKQYGILIDLATKDSNISKEAIQKMKNDGLLVQPYEMGMRIHLEVDGPLDQKLLDEYAFEMDKDKDTMEKLLKLHGFFYSISDKIKTIYKNLDADKIEDIGEERLFLQILFMFHRVISCFIDSIIHLNCYKKYSEVNALSRYVMESSFLIYYFHQYPYEAKRWLDFQNISLLRHTEKKDNWWYRDLDFLDFKSYLLEKGYSEIANNINPNNFKGAKWFAPSFIRKKVNYDRLFNTTEKEIRWSVKDLYNLKSMFIHPSIATSLYKNKRNINQELGTLTITYLFFDAVNEILLSEYGDLIPEDMKNDVEALINKANENVC